MAKTLAKLVRVLLTGTSFLFFWTGGAILSWLIVPILQLRYAHDPIERGRRCGP